MATVSQADEVDIQLDELDTETLKRRIGSSKSLMLSNLE